MSTISALEVGASQQTTPRQNTPAADAKRQKAILDSIPKAEAASGAKRRAIIADAVSEMKKLPADKRKAILDTIKPAAVFPEWIEAKSKKGQTYRVPGKFISHTGYLIAFMRPRNSENPDYLQLKGVKRGVKKDVEAAKVEYLKLVDQHHVIINIVRSSTGTMDLAKLAARKITRGKFADKVRIDKVEYTDKCIGTVAQLCQARDAAKARIA